MLLHGVRRACCSAARNGPRSMHSMNEHRKHKRDAYLPGRRCGQGVGGEERRCLGCGDGNGRHRPCSLNSLSFLHRNQDCLNRHSYKPCLGRARSQHKLSHCFMGSLWCH